MNKTLILSLIVLLFTSCNQPDTGNENADHPVIATISFENCDTGEFTEVIENGIRVAAPGHIRIYSKNGRSTSNSLHIGEGENNLIEIINGTGREAKFVSFLAKPQTRKSPVLLNVEYFDGTEWKKIEAIDDEVNGDRVSKVVFFELPSSIEQKIRVKVDSTGTEGALIDNITFFSDADMQVDSVLVPYHVFPVLKGKESNPVLNIQVYVSGISNGLVLNEINLSSGENDLSGIVQSMNVYGEGSQSYSNCSVAFGEKYFSEKGFTFSGKQKLRHGLNSFFVTCEPNSTSNLSSDVVVECTSIKINGKEYWINTEKKAKNHLGIALRQHNDDDVDTYRIPGLATTNKGTLIGVYDIRYNSGVDLQEDVDVGMNRSTDGGQTWEPMKIIMDMKEWGGLPEDQNGIGDPSVLVDRETNTIWVAAVWAHGHPGQRNWWASRPGLEPETTSQFVLVKSYDDGATWSEPINITKQIKDKDWYLLLQGPGKGITLKDGTLVFPAQFKDKDDMPHSTIIYSKNHGKNWTIGTGAKSNTTEAQVIELNDGGLMLNMRDNRNGKDNSGTNGRAVAVTYDFGKTWTAHATSNGALKEPTCMASLIKADFEVNGEIKSLVLFSNPNSKFGRHHMTIKASLDDGETWQEDHQLLIDSGGGRGYSCMTKIDDKHIGILYEGSQADLIFQKFAVEEILQGN